MDEETSQSQSQSQPAYQRIQNDENTVEDAYVNVDGEDDSNTQLSTGAQLIATATSRLTFSNAFQARTSGAPTTSRSTQQPSRQPPPPPPLPPDPASSAESSGLHHIYLGHFCCCCVVAVVVENSLIFVSLKNKKGTYSDWSEEDGRRVHHKVSTRSKAQAKQNVIVKTRSGRISTRRVVKPVDDDDEEVGTLDTTAATTTDEPSTSTG